MRAALALAGLALVFAVSASGSTPAARILFTNGADVVLIDADGTNYQNLTPGQPDFYTADNDGDWSPDGSRIVFTSHRDSNVSSEIYVMDADGSHQQRLTFDGPNGVQQTGGDVFDYLPAFSPDGGAIAYLKSVRSQVDLWLMGADGSRQRRLTFDGGTKNSFSWSPDGTRLAYDSTGGIFVVATVGGRWCTWQTVTAPRGRRTERGSRTGGTTASGPSGPTGRTRCA